jgi:hypothetical protein
MISIKIIGKGKQSSTLITISNYSSFQSGEETQENTQRKRKGIRKGNAEETQRKRNVPTIEEEEERKENIIPPTKKVGSIESFSQELRDFMRFKIAPLFPEDVIKNLTSSRALKWIDAIDKLERLDNYTKDEIYNMVKWAREDDFWRSNFLSVVKLRMNNKDGTKYHIVFSEKIKSMGINEDRSDRNNYSSSGSKYNNPIL